MSILLTEPRTTYTVIKNINRETMKEQRTRSFIQHIVREGNMTGGGGGEEAGGGGVDKMGVLTRIPVVQCLSLLA